MFAKAWRGRGSFRTRQASGEGAALGSQKVGEGPMTNAEILAKAILDIELVIAENLQPGHTRYPQRALEQILAIIDETKAIEAAERVHKGFTGPTLVK